MQDKKDDDFKNIIDSNNNIKEALAIMIENGVDKINVVEDGKIIGTVVFSDIAGIFQKGK